MANEFAIINLNKTNQFIVKKGDIFTIDRLSNEPELTVLMYVNGDTVELGKPFLDGFGVKLEVIEDKLDKKIRVGRFRNKSRYRRNNGHRQPVSIIKVVDFGNGVATKVLRSATEQKSVENTEKLVKNTKVKAEKSVQKPRTRVSKSKK